MYIVLMHSPWYGLAFLGRYRNRYEYQKESDINLALKFDTMQEAETCFNENKPDENWQLVKIIEVSI